MRWRWAIPLALAVFLYAAVMKAPAATLFAWFAPRNLPVQVSGIGGTLHHGTVSAVSFKDHVALSNLSWHLQPLWLLLGRAALHIQGGDESTTLNGDLQASPGALRAGPLKLGTDLKSVLTLAGFPFLQVDGIAQLDIVHLRTDGQHLRDLQGHLKLQGLRWSLGQKPLQLGDFVADSSTDAQGVINTSIHSVSGPLDVSGTVTLDADSHYQLDLKLKAKPDAPPELVQMLQSMGRPGSGGYYRIQNKGSLAAGLPGVG